MKWLRAAAKRVAGLWLGAQRDDEMAAELEAHLQLHVDDNVRAGMTTCSISGCCIFS